LKLKSAFSNDFKKRAIGPYFQNIFFEHLGAEAHCLLSADNFRQLYIPPNFAHGFVVTSESAQFEYKCTNFYDPASELTIAWDDPDIGIPWPIEEPTVSDKDARGERLRDIEARLPRYTANAG